MTIDPVFMEQARALVLAKLKGVSLEAALSRVEHDEAMYRGFAESCLRNGQSAAAGEHAYDAACCAKAALALTDIVASADEYRALARKLAAARKAEKEAARQQAMKDEADRRRRRSFAEQRTREKATGQKR